MKPYIRPLIPFNRASARSDIEPSDHNFAKYKPRLYCDDPLKKTSILTDAKSENNTLSAERIIDRAFTSAVRKYINTHLVEEHDAMLRESEDKHEDVIFPIPTQQGEQHHDIQ